jgi:ABC-type transporter Mla subunit MlaD
MDKLKAARGAFSDLLNALDDAREDVTEEAEDIIDGLVAKIETAVREFDAAFAETIDADY